MTREELNNRYFNWVCKLIGVNPYAKKHTYYDLLYLLNQIEFTYSLPMDGNRYEDGIDLRYRFAINENYPDSQISCLLDDQPCSVLEMMVALAIRLEEHIMDNPDVGNRTGLWFWDMIDSLGLYSMYDGRFDESEAMDIIQRFLDRDYDYDGDGGLFTVTNCNLDMRNIEIWYQANYYLTSMR